MILAVDTVIKQYTHLLVLRLFGMKDCRESSDMYVIAVAVMVHCVSWTELTDSSSYGASCVLDGTD
jgi:hypothetical protein